jgi:POT family proton-dependent oligopeptide transporter
LHLVSPPFPLLGILFFYLPGLFIIASSTVPGLLLGTHSFNLGAYKVALLVLWYVLWVAYRTPPWHIHTLMSCFGLPRPVGAGTVKAVVNIFGARQHHPIVQRTLVESFYVVFYMTINVGAVAGCLVIPIVARTNVTVAYALPFVLLLVAVLCFVAGSKRYVHAVPGRDSPAKPSMADAESNALDEDTSKFSDVARVCALIVPFNIVYSQCPTTCKCTTYPPCDQSLVLFVNKLVTKPGVCVCHQHVCQSWYKGR